MTRQGATLSPSFMNTEPVRFPHWKEVLSLSALSTVQREVFRREILNFLRYCKIHRAAANAALMKQHLLEQEPGPSPLLLTKLRPIVSRDSFSVNSPKGKSSESRAGGLWLHEEIHGGVAVVPGMQSRRRARRSRSTSAS